MVVEKGTQIDTNLSTILIAYSAVVVVMMEMAIHQGILE